MYPFLRLLGIAKITTTTHLRKEKKRTTKSLFRKIFAHLKLLTANIHCFF